MAKKKAQGAPPAKKSGRVSLYLPPEQHAELAFIAEALGLDMNGLLRLMIGRSIHHYRREAETLVLEQQEPDRALATWRERHPGRPAREYWDEYFNGLITKFPLLALAWRYSQGLPPVENP
jgi:hypothetical protein